MFLPFFIFFALPSLVFSQSLAKTTITPDADNLIAGSWTISVALPTPTTLEVFIETLFNKYNSVTLVGPTTFTSLVRDRSKDSATATGATQDSTTSNTPSSGGNGGSQTTSAAASVSTGNGAASRIPSGGSKATDSSSSSTLAAPPSVGTQNQPHYGMDPDSAMAIEYDKAYANVTYTPPAYVPAKIPSDVCVLWDPSCKGNKTLAAEEFFGHSKANSSGGTMSDLLLDPCFDGQGTDASGTNCTSSLLNPASASFSSAAKSYMREPQCSKDYESIYPVSSRAFDECCGVCYIYGPNVDVYYWPEPSADTSCLSIIGSDVIPLNAGAQTDGAGVVYWAASTNLYDIYVPTVTTALITTINGIVVKEAIANPWDASPSITTTRPVSSIKKRNPLSVHPRAFNPLYGRELGTARNSSLDAAVTASAKASEVTGSIAVSDGFTFTSPSVYVAFYSLSATDNCGVRGNNIKSTMLAFAPGELSTVQGHLWGGGVQEQKTKVFDFADLPCPPYDVMYDDWYKPAPGEPYRPLIALPEKVRDLDPWWSACTDAFYFTGLDPPRTLQKATALVTPAAPAANPDPTITPDPVQPVPPLPVQTNAGQPAKAADDPSDNKDPDNRVPPTPTLKQADPQQGDTSKGLADPAAVDPGTNNNVNPPASPQNNDKDPQQGTDPKANDPGSNNPGNSGSGPNHSGSNDSGSNAPASNNSGAKDSSPKDSGSNDPGSSDSKSHDSGSSDSGSNAPASNNSGAKDSSPKDSGSNDPGSSDSQSHDSGSSDSGSNDPGSNGSGANDSTPKGSESNDPGSNDSGSTTSGANDSRPKDSGSSDSSSHNSGSNDSGSHDSGSNDSGPHGSASNDSPAANSPASSPADPQSGHGQQEVDPKKASSGQQSQQNDASAPASGSASNSDHQAAQANSNTGSQLGSENQDSAPQSPTNNDPSQSGNSNAGTSTSPSGSSDNQHSSSEASPVLKIPGALPLTQAPNDHNAYLIAGSTLLPGSSAAFVSGTSYSLASSGALVVGTSTIPLATAGAVAGQIASPGALWAGNVAFTPLLGGSAIVGSSTLSLSGPAITSSGSVFSLASGGLVVGPSTYAFATPASNPAASSTTQEVPITTALAVAGQSFTANPSGFSINGTTISAGGPGVTLSGTPVSLDRSGNLVVGTSTVALESTSIGPAATSVVAYEGSGVRSKTSCWMLAGGLVASMLRWLL